MTATRNSGLRWLRIPDLAETFEVTGEPFVCIGINRKTVQGGTLESKIYQPAVQVRDEKGADFLLSLSKTGMVEVFQPATSANGGRWEGISFTAQASRNADGSYRSKLEIVGKILAGANGNGR